MRIAFHLFCQFVAFLDATVVVTSMITLTQNTGLHAAKDAFDILLFSMFFTFARCQFDPDVFLRWWHTGKIEGVTWPHWSYLPRFVGLTLLYPAAVVVAEVLGMRRDIWLRIKYGYWLLNKNFGSR
jgi:hypothetical protein